MKTDLARILSVSGQHGLFNYIAQARNGAIVEALSDKRRTCFDMKSRITTLHVETRSISPSIQAKVK